MFFILLSFLSAYFSYSHIFSLVIDLVKVVMASNLTSLLPDNTTSSWEVVATILFCIEGVLTPLVSLGGLIGKLVNFPCV